MPEEGSIRAGHRLHPVALPGTGCPIRGRRLLRPVPRCPQRRPAATASQAGKRPRGLPSGWIAGCESAHATPWRVRSEQPLLGYDFPLAAMRFGAFTWRADHHVNAGDVVTEASSIHRQPAGTGLGYHGCGTPMPSLCGHQRTAHFETWPQCDEAYTADRSGRPCTSSRVCHRILACHLQARALSQATLRARLPTIPVRSPASYCSANSGLPRMVYRHLGKFVQPQK
jgi:hypothetical protein